MPRSNRKNGVSIEVPTPAEVLSRVEGVHANLLKILAYLRFSQRCVLPDRLRLQACDRFNHAVAVLVDLRKALSEQVKREPN